MAGNGDSPTPEELQARVDELERTVEEMRSWMRRYIGVTETRETATERSKRRWGTSAVAPVAALGAFVREHRVTAIAAAGVLGLSMWGVFDDPFRPDPSTPPVAEAPRIPQWSPQQQREPDETPTPDATMDETGGTTPGPPSGTQAPGSQPGTQPVADAEPAPEQEQPEPEPPQDGDDESPVDVEPPDDGGDGTVPTPQPVNGEGAGCELLHVEALETVEVCL